MSLYPAYTRFNNTMLPNQLSNTLFSSSKLCDWSTSAATLLTMSLSRDSAEEPYLHTEGQQVLHVHHTNIYTAATADIRVILCCNVVCIEYVLVEACVA